MDEDYATNPGLYLASELDYHLEHRPYQLVNKYTYQVAPDGTVRNFKVLQKREEDEWLK